MTVACSVCLTFSPTTWCPLLSPRHGSFRASWFPRWRGAERWNQHIPQHPTTNACFWTIWRSEFCEIDLKIWQSRYKCSDMKTGSITIIKVSPPIWMLGLPVTCYWVARRYSRIYRKFKLTTSWCLETCHSDPLGITWPCCCTAVLPLMEPGTTSSGIDALGLRLIVLDDEVHTAMPSLFTHVCMSLYTSFCIRGCSNIQSHQM